MWLESGSPDGWIEKSGGLHVPLRPEVLYPCFGGLSPEMEVIHASTVLITALLGEVQLTKAEIDSWNLQEQPYFQGLKSLFAFLVHMIQIRSSLARLSVLDFQMPLLFILPKAMMVFTE